VFFDGWQGLVRVVVVGTLAYVALVVILRISGNRTLSKMNAFDLVVTVALGSTLATVLLSESVALAEGVLALALLIALQYVATWLSVRSSAVRSVVKSQPVLLLYDGEFLEREMHRQRVLESEVRAAIRASGIASLSAVKAVVLETDGTFSVISASDDGKPLTALKPLDIPESARRRHGETARRRHGETARKSQ
jgi:uncharacterized membrane protein YcaP (DUF421 family)